MHGLDRKRLLNESLEQAPAGLSNMATISFLNVSSDEVSMIVVPRLPGHDPFTSQPLGKTTVKREELKFRSLTEGSEAIYEYIYKLHIKTAAEIDIQKSDMQTCGLDIDVLYPISHDTEQHESSSLKSPLAILT